MNQTIWQPLIDKLPEWVDAQAIDLPGHGQRCDESFRNLDDLTRDVQKYCIEYKKHDQPLILVGWSLGALPCLKVAAESPDSVDALMVVSSNPCFVSRENWNYGIGTEIFDQFAQSLKDNFSGTIRRFLSLQVKGSESGRVILRDLREKILQQPRPGESSLDAGLEILKQTNLCSLLENIKQPVSWVLGGQDGLVKVELAEVLNEYIGQAELQIYKKSGHAPFLSHTDEFMQQLMSFMQKSVAR